MSDSKSYQIEIHGLSLYGYHGVYPEENKLGQTFRMDLTVTVDRAERKMDDDAESVVSYAEIVERVCDTFSAKSYKLLETLADAILGDLAAFGRIRHARIRIKKPHAPIPYPLSHVGIVVEKSYR